MIDATLSKAARKALEEMSPNTVKFFSDSQRKLFAEGVVKGVVKGGAEAVLKILARRRIAVSDVQRVQILECTDPGVVDRWIDQAVVVSSVDELFA